MWALSLGLHLTRHFNRGERIDVSCRACWCEKVSIECEEKMNYLSSVMKASMNDEYDVRRVNNYLEMFQIVQDRLHILSCRKPWKKGTKFHAMTEMKVILK